MGRVGLLLGITLNIFVIAIGLNSVFDVIQLDLFSLFSFGLAISSILFGGFAVWLSWEFKKQSDGSNLEVKRNLEEIRLSTELTGSKIDSIVEQAFKYYLGIQDAPNNNEQENGDEIVEKNVQAIFPGYKIGPAVHSDFEIIRENLSSKEGMLEIEVLRPTKNATAVITFKDPFESDKKITVRYSLKNHPITPPFQMRTGAVLPTGFNFHITSSDFLSPGKYLLKIKISAIGAVESVDTMSIADENI